LSAAQVPLPEDPPWWELFNVQPALMFEVCREMHQLYARPQAQYIPVYRSMLASKPPTPASPSGHQRPPEGGTGERLGGHNAAGTPAFTPQAAADLERPSSQVDLLLVSLVRICRMVCLPAHQVGLLHVVSHMLWFWCAGCVRPSLLACAWLCECVQGTARLLDEDITISLSTQNKPCCLVFVH
jgi:hypothetical protein